jgi:hypothetical protein
MVDVEGANQGVRNHVPLIANEDAADFKGGGTVGYSSVRCTSIFATHAEV